MSSTHNPEGLEVRVIYRAQLFALVAHRSGDGFCVHLVPDEGIKQAAAKANIMYDILFAARDAIARLMDFGFQPHHQVLPQEDSPWQS